MKLFITICAFALGLAILSASASVFAESGYIRGDSNGDGKVNVNDATTIQKYLAEIPVASFNLKAADVDENGLGIKDATKIQKCLAGYANLYKIGEAVGGNTEPSRDEYELPFVPFS